MKTLRTMAGHWIIVLMFLTFSVPVFSQAWVPLGTEWSYTEHNYPQDILGVSKIKAVYELMDEGRMVTKLIVESPVNCPYEPDWVYTYYTPEKEVFMKFPQDSVYTKYFDFTAQPGDEFEILFKIDTLQERMRIYVDSVDIIMIFDEPRIRVRGWIDLKWLVFVEQPEFCWIEGIGDVYTSMFLGQSLHCDSGANSTIHGFRCFTDTEESIYNPYNVNCDDAMSTNTRNIGIINDIKFFPNPVKNELFFETQELDSWAAEIFHVSGQRMHTSVVSGKSLAIPGNIKPGIYFVQLKDNFGNSKTFIMLKE